jgi:8-oxo-dGTP pyrophosphatase MutT (NUDIX family)
MVQKVVAYIVRDGRIVVFTHADDSTMDESGIQVPAGTLEPGELPADAVLREAREETGLSGLRIVRYLGAAEYDMRPSQDTLQIRHFFQLTVDGDVRERWYEYERGDGSLDPIRFELYWLPLRQVQVVGAGQAALAGRIVDSDGS